MSSTAIDPTTFETLSPSRYITFTIPHPHPTSPLLRLAVLDSPNPLPTAPTTAALLVPPSRPSDWLFSTPAGHLHLLLSSPLPLSRLILAGAGSADISEESLTPLLLALAPRSAFTAGVPDIPFLTYEDPVTSSVTVEIATGPVAGDMLVEDVEIAGSEYRRRRLRFKRMPHLVQTQVRLLPDPTHPALVHPESASLVQPYLAPMVASLSVIAPYIEAGTKPRALCIGVGGGALPMFLESELGFDVVAVEADDVVVGVARRHFGLVEGEFLKVIVGDGIELMEEYGRSGAKGFDVIMVDLDEADAASGVNAPPLEFLEKRVLLAARAAMPGHGLLVVNVIASQGEGFYKGVIDSFREVFHELHELDVGNGENYVLIASNSSSGSVSGAGGGQFCAKLKRVIGERYIDHITRI